MGDDHEEPDGEEERHERPRLPEEVAGEGAPGPGEGQEGERPNPGEVLPSPSACSR